MLAAVLLLSVYLLLLVLSLKNAKYYGYGSKFGNLYPILGVILILSIIFRGIWMPDYGDYVTSFFSDDNRMEITWILFRSMTAWTGEPKIIFLIYGSISVIFTIKAIVSQSKAILISLLVWISYIFIIQDMIQIRQGVSSAIFLYTIRYINSRNLNKFIIWNLIGATFHISALAVLPLYLLGKIGLHRKLFLIIIPIAYCLYFLQLGVVYLIQYIEIDFIKSLWITKSQTLYVTERVNLFNVRQIILVLISMFLWVYIKNINRYWAESVIYIKIFTTSLVVFILFFDVPDIASRINVIYSVAEIIAIPALIYSSKHMLSYKYCVLFISVIFFTTYYSRFVLP